MQPFVANELAIVKALLVPVELRCFRIIVPFLARPISLSLRLYGNLFAGEMIFLLLAALTLRGAAQLSSFSGWFFVVVQFALGVVWTAYSTCW